MIPMIEVKAYSDTTIERIARVAHESNRAYCRSIGDMSQPTWDEAPEWQKTSAMAGVSLHLYKPETTAAESHAAWMEQKVAEGWKHGPVKDVEKKEHPCMVPYENLPVTQRVKDYLFAGVVRAMAKGIDGE